MGVFEQFPYTNFHDLNLDWIIKKVKDLDNKVNDDLDQIITDRVTELLNSLSFNAIYDAITETITLEVE